MNDQCILYILRSWSNDVFTRYKVLALNHNTYKNMAAQIGAIPLYLTTSRRTPRLRFLRTLCKSIENNERVIDRTPEVAFSISITFVSIKRLFSRFRSVFAEVIYRSIEIDFYPASRVYNYYPT
ncbi:hypothetical protein PUN28_009172 [Cardiocondyla obscurior]|uniref:Uncharacterized protein n=1 Tax=Cardiocondyla obscurior TaxID=286306 RepID=A0AAW2FQV0_9HYME